MHDTRHTNTMHDTRHTNTMQDTRHTNTMQDTRHTNTMHDTRHINTMHDTRHTNTMHDTRPTNTMHDTRHTNTPYSSILTSLFLYRTKLAYLKFKGTQPLKIYQKLLYYICTSSCSIFITNQDLNSLNTLYLEHGRVKTNTRYIASVLQVPTLAHFISSVTVQPRQ
jgi:hypothetical protein